eukprot:Gb_38895 [translate_table: standard]
MAAIKSTARSASVAFAPEAPLLAAGTMAGAIDLSFSSSANLEIFKLDFQSDDPELPVVGECPSSERFNRLSWGNTGAGSQEYSLGVIAGGLVDGSISIWNPATLMNSEDIEGALIARLQKHTGPVRGLEFNANSPNLLASGAEDGELCIWDLANPTAPTHFPSLKGVGSGAQGEVSFLSWNRKVQHILASTSYSGTTVVWDLRRQKPVISFPDSTRRRCSVLQWNPDAATQLIVASDDDRSPALRVWDVRNTISPVKEFIGHSKGVIAMSWCPSDSSYLLTCAKDNRTLCWDTVSGEIVSELPAGTNWNFDVQWSPRTPGVLSASSFDGKIGIYNIEACSRMVSGEGEFGGALASGGSSAFAKAPKWLKRPVGVSFGFGGKLASFRPSEVQGAVGGPSEVYIHNLVTEDNLVIRSMEFEAAIADGEKTSMRALCHRKAEDTMSEEEKETWNFLRVMFEDEGTARTKLLAHLGFKVQSVENGESQETQSSKIDDISHEIANRLTLDDRLIETKTEVDATVQLKHGQDVAFPQDNGEEFFDNLHSPKEDTSASLSGNDFAVEKETTTNGVEAEHEAEGSTEYSDCDEAIQHSLVVGDYKGAVVQCLSANRMADALIIAHVGGGALWEKTRDEYLKKTNCSYLKVVSAMVNNDLMGLVNSRPLKSWKETLALLCTFSQREEWTVLCDTLASRLITAGNTLAATLCYICAGNIEKTVEIWSQSLKADYDGRSFVDRLQDLMEKTVILALATGQKRVSPSLSKLVESYAELLASQGLLSTAMEYLKLLGTEESSHELAILRDRIYLSGTDKMTEPSSFPFETRELQSEPQYGTDQMGFRAPESSQQYYQENLHHGGPGGPYTDTYQQTANVPYTGTYPSTQQQQSSFQNYMTPAPYQTATSPQLFYPSSVPQPPQANFAPPVSQPLVKPFVPSTPPVLRNVEQYQQPPVNPQLYPGVSPAGTHPYQIGGPASVSVGPTPVQPSLVPNVMLPAPATAPAAPPRSFMPVTTPGAPQQAGMSPQVRPQSPTQASQVQPMTAAPAPLPTIQNVDTSNVAAEIRPVIGTLTRLYNETSEALGGARANPAKKREIDDNSRKFGSLFAKLNSGDISPNAASKLVQLCQALDSGDCAAALQIQVGLTTSDWDECSFWLAALKRMIKTRQNMR